ncbi:DUF4123 domain-containing protein, partial [Xanthomonas fragariae]|uniref:DUF4123 domain-containing protein n=2 Tax=Xanthomonas fragariae TaxID=48664 RepID=UPI001F394630
RVQGRAAGVDGAAGGKCGGKRSLKCAQIVRFQNADRGCWRGCDRPNSGLNTMHHRFYTNHRYGIINPLQIEVDAWINWPSVSIAPKELRGQSDILPRLINFSTLSHSHQIELLDHMQEWEKSNPRMTYFSALLTSDADERKVVNHLARQMLQKTSDRECMLLRFYDPRVFGHLQWILDERQINYLLGPIEKWSWRLLDGSWAYQPRSADTGGLGLKLTESQWGVLSRIGVLNRTSVHLTSAGIPVGDIRFVASVIEQAYERWGMEDESDIFLFVEQVLLTHLGIHDHPELSRRLEQVQMGQVSYVGACLDLDITKLSKDVIGAASNKTWSVYGL